MSNVSPYPLRALDCGPLGRRVIPLPHWRAEYAINPPSSPSVALPLAKRHIEAVGDGATIAPWARKAGREVLTAANRYAVALPLAAPQNDGRTLPAAKSVQIAASVVSRLDDRDLTELALTLRDLPVWLGVWRTPKQDVLLEPALVVNNREAALAFAKAGNQHSVWDFAFGGEISPGTGEPC